MSVPPHPGECEQCTERRMWVYTWGACVCSCHLDAKDKQIAKTWQERAEELRMRVVEGGDRAQTKP